MADMYEFNLQSSSLELAGEIIQLPDGFDFSQTNLFSSFLVAKDPSVRDPKKYAHIFENAMLHPKVSIWMKFACWAERINGLRRTKGADMPALASDLNELVKQASEYLPNGNDKYTLLGTSFYNMGIIRRGLRQYWEAAKDQRHASAWYKLAGNTEKQLISLFVARVEETTAAFVAGDVDGIKQSIRAMIASRDRIANVVKPYPVWMKQNASIHIAWAASMAFLGFGLTIVGLSEDDGPGEDHFRNWRDHSPAQWAKAAHAVELYYADKFSEVVGQNAVDIQSSSADNAGLTVKIFVALAHRELGKKAKAKKILTEVMNHAGPDGGIPIAVATRLLAK
ncbi:MAG: hypothetical protein Q8O83_04885 [bacterium]|nr:hypothetical protein [bacterium]